jgi:HK97 gp10 family phage protein
MSVNMEIDVEGSEELKQALNRLDVEMQNRLHERLAEWAEHVRAEASRQAPARTGYLCSTIFARTREWQAEIGAEAAYAANVEFGTSRAQAKPFLQPAAEANLPQLEHLVAEALERAAAEAGLL